MIPVVEAYIKERKGVDVHILYPDNNVQLILLQMAYGVAKQWEENKATK